MKKYLLVATLFLALGAKSQGPVNNNGFENWAIDTFDLPANLVPGLPADTISFLDPLGWTSSNALTDLDSFHKAILVTPDSTPQSGLLDIKLSSLKVKLPDTLYHEYSTEGAKDTIVFPGFAISGKFPFSENILLAGGLSGVNPGKVVGAGQPFTQRLASVKGYFKYLPAYDTLNSAYDACQIYAVLRQGTNNLIATAIFTSNVVTSSWQPFTANFVYSNCDMPDTLVIMLSSSVPSLLPIIEDALPLGSELFVDSLYYDTLAASAFPVWASPVLDTVLENSSNNLLNVTSKDSSCITPLTCSIVSGPAWGSASVANDSEISYTPTASYSGPDTIVYSANSSGGGSASATLAIWVKAPAGINDINLLAVSIYPVPASNSLNVNFQNPGKTYAKIYDMLGRIVGSATFTSNNNQVNLDNLSNGIYSLELVSSENVVVARAKFTVAK